MPELHELTATQARDAIARGETTSEALVKACLERVAKRDKDVGAWAYLDPEQALRQARAADEAKRSGSTLGLLHGVPVGIKDIIDTADMPTQNGSVYFEGRQPAEDATCVAALRAAGAVIMGKTVTTELATLTPPKTRNPHNPEHTPGGSSSGSAAAVASGMIPAALATQTGGSVIRPASFCGIYALKPTLGLISRSGVLLQSHTLDTVGVYGRSIEDLALLTDCLAAHDPKDPMSFPRGPSRLLDVARSMPPAKPRLAFVRSPAWAEAEEAARATFTDFVEGLGDHCETVELPVLGPVIAAHRIVQSSENAVYYGPLIERDRRSFSTGLIERLEAGQRITARAYIEAIMLRETAAASVEQVLARYTAIIMPAAPGPAPANLRTTGNPVFNGMWTYLGMPAVTLPLLCIGGLPFGVQLIGARRDEGRLLRTARWLVRHASTIGSPAEPPVSQRL